MTINHFPERVCLIDAAFYHFWHNKHSVLQPLTVFSFFAVPSHAVLCLGPQIGRLQVALHIGLCNRSQDGAKLVLIFVTNRPYQVVLTYDSPGLVDQLVFHPLTMTLLDVNV